jgi:hypothetical protein
MTQHRLQFSTNLKRVILDEGCESALRSENAVKRNFVFIKQTFVKLQIKRDPVGKNNFHVSRRRKMYFA